MNAIIIGASSGIGQALAQKFLHEGYRVGIVGRRVDLLEKLQIENPDNCFIEGFDIGNLPEISDKLDKLVSKLGGLDLIVICAATSDTLDISSNSLENPTIKTNIIGFVALCDWAYNFFHKTGKGHLAAITSIGGLRGNRNAPVYCASKAFQINYLEGLRQKRNHHKLPIFITDIRPGFVQTRMAVGEGLFWVIPLEKAVYQIYKAIKGRKKIVYVTKRWSIIAVISKLIPTCLWQKM